MPQKSLGTVPCPVAIQTGYLIEPMWLRLQESMRVWSPQAHYSLTSWTVSDRLSVAASRSQPRPVEPGWPLEAGRDTQRDGPAFLACILPGIEAEHRKRQRRRRRGQHRANILEAQA